MSSSSDVAVAGRVLRDVAVGAAVLVDLEVAGRAGAVGIDPGTVERTLEEARARGYAEGLAAGRAEGHAAGLAAAVAEAERAEACRAVDVRAALDALVEAASQLAAREATAVAAVEDEIVGVAFELARAVVGRELEVAVDPGRHALARALALVPGRTPAVARLHPHDVATLDGLAELDRGREVTVVADDSVERGGCLLDVGDTRVDAQVGSALARVRQVLGL